MVPLTAAQIEQFNADGYLILDRPIPNQLEGSKSEEVHRSLAGIVGRVGKQFGCTGTICATNKAFVVIDTTSAAGAIAADS